MRNLLRIAVGLVAAAALAWVGTAWASRPTGNAAAIAYARSVAKAYSHVPAVAILETGYVAMHSYRGKVSGFAWKWGTGVVPAGWVPVAESSVVRLKSGRVAWFTDVLIPPGCRPAACPEPPVEIVANAHGGYWRLDLPSARACYRKLRGATPLTIGQRFVSVGGHFGPLIRQGNSVLTNYTYAWDSRPDGHRDRRDLETNRIGDRDARRGLEGFAPASAEVRLPGGLHDPEDRSPATSQGLLAATCSAAVSSRCAHRSAAARSASASRRPRRWSRG